MENLNLKDLSSLERMYANSTDNNPTNLNNGFNSKKNINETITKPVYKSNFSIKSLITDTTYTNMNIPAIVDAVGNNIVKVGTAISAIIASIGYLIDKIKG